MRRYALYQVPILVECVLTRMIPSGHMTSIAPVHPGEGSSSVLSWRVLTLFAREGLFGSLSWSDGTSKVRDDFVYRLKSTLRHMCNLWEWALQNKLNWITDVLPRFLLPRSSEVSAAAALLWWLVTSWDSLGGPRAFALISLPPLLLFDIPLRRWIHFASMFPDYGVYFFSFSPYYLDQHPQPHRAQAVFIFRARWLIAGRGIVRIADDRYVLSVVWTCLLGIFNEEQWTLLSIPTLGAMYSRCHDSDTWPRATL